MTAPLDGEAGMSGSDVVVVGAGGLGREVLAYAADAARAGWPWRVRGVLDDNPAALADLTGSPGFDDLIAPGAPRPTVLGPLRDPALLGGHVLIAAGDPLLRRELRLLVAAAGGTLVPLVHPGAYVGAGARIGDGAIIAPGAFVGAFATVAANVVVNALVSVGHDSIVSADSVLSPHVALSGSVRIGDGVLVGTHSALLPGVEVGSWSRIAAGAVVTRDCPPGSLLTGNPAKGRVMFADPTDPGVTYPPGPVST